MAASYWDSTQRRFWTFPKPRLSAMRASLDDESRSLAAQFPLPERRLLNVYCMQQIQRLAKKLQTNIRQQALATAQVYVKRYYLTVEVRRTNPHLVLAAALYIACKMEECPQHIRIVVVEAHNLWPDSVPADMNRLGECEFAIIAELSSQLIVHHPYRSLADIQKELGLDTDETALAWSVVNDHYLTDLPLLYAPHVVAVTAAVLAVVLRPTAAGAAGGQHQATAAAGAALHAVTLSKALDTMAAPATGAGGPATAAGGGAPGPSGRVQRMAGWLAESSVDMEAVVDCTQELISLYDAWEGYNEKACRDQIARFVKARGLDK